MTYRMISALLLCFMLVSCAGTPLPAAPDEEPLPLPERFLGTWVYSYYDIISIHPGGLIKNYRTEDKDAPLSPPSLTGSVKLGKIEISPSYIPTSAYRVIYIENPYSVYLIHRDNNPDPEHRYYTYIHMSIDPTEYLYKEDPTRLAKPHAMGWTFGCDTTDEDWSAPQSILRERLLGSDPDHCTIKRLREERWPHRLYWRGTGLQVNQNP